MAKKTKENKAEATLVVSQVSKDNKETEPSKKEVKYVVVREGHRVSDKEYSTPNDPVAVSEYEFWNRISEKWSRRNGAVEIVQYDNKLHRIW